MLLVYKKSNNTIENVATVNNEEEAIKEIKKYCDNNNYEIPYINISSHSDKIIYDIGSYTQFFYLYYTMNRM